MEPVADTFPRLLLAHARSRPDDPATREKDLGIWQTWTWREVADEVRAIACGLAAEGFGRGMHLAIVGDNRPRLYWAMTAAQALGGVPVPLYQDAVAEEMAFVLEHAEARFAVAEDQEQVDKLLAIKGRLPGLEIIVFCDGRGMRHYAQPFLLDYAAIQQKGRELAAAKPDFLAAEIAKGGGGDTAIIV